MLNYIKKSPHRNLLNKELRKLAPLITGDILDAGSKNKPYENFFEGKITAIDIKPRHKEVVMGDITNLDFPPSYFDAVIATEVFEYITTPQKAVDEINRVLKTDGLTLISIPFMYKFHNDSIRYTKDYLKVLFSSFSRVEIYTVGNFYSIILDILRDKIIHLKSPLVRYLLYLPYLFLTLFIEPSLHIIKDKNFVSGYLIFAKK